MNVVITGSSSGIGKALAVTFARHGHAVLLVARREARLHSLCQVLNEKYGAISTCLPLDITAPDAPQVLFDEAVRIFGEVHVLVNNAGMSPYQEFRELSINHLRQILALNIRSLTELCYLFMPHMLNHGKTSHVVNVGSVGSYAPLPRFSVYSGSKHYVRAFTNLLSDEYRESNIKVSGLYPGGTITEFLGLAGQQVNQLAQKSMMIPEQVAEIAYPSILKGRRVIVPGTINQLAILAGKLLPFPIAVRMMKFIYNRSIKPAPPTYPL